MAEVKGIKVKSALLRDAVTIPGSKVNGDFTLSGQKQEGLQLSYANGLLLVENNGHRAAIPFSNVKVMILE